MKRKVFSILVAVFVLLSSSGVLASSATAWLQTNEEYTDGKVETEVIAEAVNGEATLVLGSAPSGLNYNSPVQFKFVAEDGYTLNPNWSSDFRANVVGGYVSAQMQAVWPESVISDSVSPNLDLYYDLVINQVGQSTDKEITLEVNVVRNEVRFPFQKMLAHLEPELSVDITVTFYREESPTYYKVSAVSDPAGVATFTGTGTQFQSGDEYNVQYTIVNPNYRFVRWSESNSGVIEEGDVNLVAIFERIPTPPNPVTYTVTAVSNPVGVATFIGTGAGFGLGSNYAVYYNLIDDNYVFTGWTGVSSGTITGNVNLIANFAPKTYNVTAVSSPVGVGTFTGLLNDVVNGTTYDVKVDSITEGYEFVGWTGGTPSGTIAGSDINLVAVFKPVELEFIDDNTPEVLDATNLPDEVLPEAGGVPIEVLSLFGALVTGTGITLRRKNNK